MRVPLAPLKAEADALAAASSRFTVNSGAASPSRTGTAGRRRAGAGEHFWQYREFSQEDGAERIDWRRSARSDKLFVRETELETARTFLFWIDPSQGFHWTSDRDTPRKSSRAAVLFMALGARLAKNGEMCGALGGPRAPIGGPRSTLRAMEDLWTLTPVSDFPKPPRNRATALIASDFYDPIETWRNRLLPVAEKCSSGVLLTVSDPIELSYPFEGRVRFRSPGAKPSQLLGRAENVREEYLERMAENRHNMQALATELGWRIVNHTTNDLPGPALNSLTESIVVTA